MGVSLSGREVSPVGIVAMDEDEVVSLVVSAWLVMGLLVEVAMESVSGREVSPVGVMAMDIVDEEGSVSVATTVQ